MRVCLPGVGSQLDVSCRVSIPRISIPLPMSSVVDRFLSSVDKEPQYICSCCFKMEYRKRVLLYSVSKLIHKETGSFFSSKLSVDGSEYVYKRCWSCIHSNRMPAQWQLNNLFVPDIPDELNDLNDLKSRLISMRYPFMKILCLPARGQSGINGSVV